MTHPTIGTLGPVTVDSYGRNRRTVILAHDGVWQPVFASWKGAVGACTFWAFESRFIVRITVSYDGQVLGASEHGGMWPEREGAERFARSCGPDAEVIKVVPYWYNPTFGDVSKAGA